MAWKRSLVRIQYGPPNEQTNSAALTRRAPKTGGGYMSDWPTSIELVEKYVVKISTPDYLGTGFLFARAENRSLVGIATAAHVVEKAHVWEQPIRIRLASTGATTLLRPADRAILIESATDSAAIVFAEEEDSKFPELLQDLSPEGKYYRVGKELGWMGYPTVAPNDLCFFSGKISAYRNDTSAYLVDGVAIHGVSGGPAFHPSKNERVMFAGLVSAYHPNIRNEGLLPGLCEVKDVGSLHQWVVQLRNLDQAQESQTPPDTVLKPQVTLPEKAESERLESQGVPQM